MLHQLTIKGFKSLRDVTLELAPLVVIFGPNAAGKSNLLEALVLLSRLVGERTLDDAFSAGIRGYPVEAFSFGEDGLEGWLSEKGKHHRPALCLKALVDAGRDLLEYEVSVGLNPRVGGLTVLKERLQRESRSRRQKGGAAVSVEDRKDPDRTIVAIRRKGKGSHPIEEPVGLGHTVVSNLQYSGSERYPDFDALRAEVGAWRVVYLDPRQAMRQAQPPREVDDIGERGEHLVPFLYRLSVDKNASKYLQAIARATSAVIPSIEAIKPVLVGSRGEVDLQIQQDGVWMPSRVVSEGTLRVLALCAMAANPYSRGLVAFEEPENGVHPRRIENVARILATASESRPEGVTTPTPRVVGEVARLVREGRLPGERVKLIVCSGGPDGTSVRPFDTKGPLFSDGEVKRALAAAEDATVAQALLVRGWMDG